MFNKIKKEITKCISECKENPKETFLVLSTMVGCIIGEIIAIETNPALIGFCAMGGALVGVSLAGISIYCCCPVKNNSSIDATHLTSDNSVASESPDEPAPTTNPPTANITVLCEPVLPTVGTQDNKGKKLAIN